MWSRGTLSCKALMDQNQYYYSSVIVCACVHVWLDKCWSYVFTHTRLSVWNASEHVGFASLGSAGYWSTTGGLSVWQRSKCAHTHTPTPPRTNKEVWLNTQVYDNQTVCKSQTSFFHFKPVIFPYERLDLWHLTYCCASSTLHLCIVISLCTPPDIWIWSSKVHSSKSDARRVLISPRAHLLKFWSLVTKISLT